MSSCLYVRSLVILPAHLHHHVPCRPCATRCCRAGRVAALAWRRRRTPPQSLRLRLESLVMWPVYSQDKAVLLLERVALVWSQDEYCGVVMLPVDQLCWSACCHDSCGGHPLVGHRRGCRRSCRQEVTLIRSCCTCVSGCAAEGLFKDSCTYTCRACRGHWDLETLAAT